MRVSLTVTDVSWPQGSAAGLEALARDADDGGLDTIWVADHLMQVVPGTADTDPVLEAHTTLGHLAARTRRVRLGTMVAAVTYRPAALLIKAVTTLDVLSDGRAWFGVGAGYQADEARALGLSLPGTAERFDRLDETLDLARRMWTEEPRPFRGRYLDLERPVCSPGPVTRPHPPILVGGTGERRTLPLAARHADAVNLFDVPDGGVTLRHKLAVLDRTCAEVGRDPGTIERTVSTRLAPDEHAEGLAERCRHLATLGLDHAVVLTDGPWTPGRVAVLAGAVDLLRT